MRTAELLTGAEKALRAVMRGLGHDPERKTEESYGQSGDTVVIHCKRCSGSAWAYVTEMRVEIKWHAASATCISKPK